MTDIPLPASILAEAQKAYDAACLQDMLIGPEKAVIEIARALYAESERFAVDAARYRWLRDGNAYAPEEEGVNGGEELDRLCDEGIDRDDGRKG